MNLRFIDIIIVNYNSTDYLLRCLSSIYDALGKEISASVYIFDNGSKDNIDILCKAFPHIKLLKNKKNIGFAKAVNVLISKTSAPEVLILNPDTFVEKGFFESMLDFMNENPDVGIAGPKIFESSGKLQGSARSFPTPMTALFGRNSIMTKIFPNNRLTRKNILNIESNVNKSINVDWVSGACMLVRRKAFEDTGLMDENFFMYWEDADWCKRMIQKDWKVIYYPGASIVHFTGKSSDRNVIQSVVEFHKSAYYLFDKYYQSPLGIGKVVVMMGLAARVCFLLALNGIRRRYIRKQ